MHTVSLGNYVKLNIRMYYHVSIDERKRKRKREKTSRQKGHINRGTDGRGKRSERGSDSCIEESEKGN